jgi:hypothetical protein
MLVACVTIETEQTLCFTFVEGRLGTRVLHEGDASTAVCTHENHGFPATSNRGEWHTSKTESLAHDSRLDPQRLHLHPWMRPPFLLSIMKSRVELLSIQLHDMIPHSTILYNCIFPSVESPLGADCYTLKEGPVHGLVLYFEHFRQQCGPNQEHLNQSSQRRHHYHRGSSAQSTAVGGGHLPDNVAKILVGPREIITCSARANRRNDLGYRIIMSSMVMLWE